MEPRGIEPLTSVQCGDVKDNLVRDYLGIIAKYVAGQFSIVRRRRRFAFPCTPSPTPHAFHSTPTRSAGQRRRHYATGDGPRDYACLGAFKRVVWAKKVS